MKIQRPAAFMLAILMTFAFVPTAQPALPALEAAAAPTNVAPQADYRGGVICAYNADTYGEPNWWIINGDKGAGGNTRQNIYHKGKLNDGTISVAYSNRDGKGENIELLKAGLGNGQFYLYFRLAESSRVREVAVYTNIRDTNGNRVYPQPFDVYVGSSETDISSSTLLGHATTGDSGIARKYKAAGDKTGRYVILDTAIPAHSACITLSEVEIYAEESAPPPPTLPPDPTEPTVRFDPETVLAGMTQKQKIGQLFILSPQKIDDGSLTDWTTEKDSAMTNYPIGGITLYSNNIRDPSQLRSLVVGFQGAARRVSGVPMFVTIDEEGGRVVRLANNEAFDLTAPPTMLSIGDTGDTQNAYNEYARIGNYLNIYGINADFVPVTDVWSNPNNTVIGDRSFGRTASRVADMVEAAIQGFHSQGMMATSKHFPGHGDTDGDSHNGFVGVTKTWAQMLECEIIPFQRAIAADVDMIMVAHIAATRIDGNTPSSLSYRMVTEKLRNELGFDGVVITDAMRMKAITNNYGAGPAAVKAIQAGCDIVLVPANFVQAWNAVNEAVNNGTISTERLDQSVLRILKLKAKYQPSTVMWKNDNGTVLERDNDVPPGSVPHYDGAAPTKASDAQYTYAFKGWSPAPAQVYGDAVYKYTATYTATLRKYNITWKNYDGTTIGTTEAEYGTRPAYSGEAPTKPADAENTYFWSGWTPELAEVTGDAEYTATFSVEELLWGDVNHDGAVDNLDAALVLRYDAELVDGIDELRGDVNFDGEVDNLDAALILRYDAGIIDSLRR